MMVGSAADKLASPPIKHAHRGAHALLWAADRQVFATQVWRPGALVFLDPYNVRLAPHILRVAAFAGLLKH